MLLDLRIYLGCTYVLVEYAERRLHGNPRCCPIRGGDNAGLRRIQSVSGAEDRSHPSPCLIDPPLARSHFN